MRWLLLCGVLLGCGGGPTTSGPCSTACDCHDTATPLGCTGGEWQCPAGTCTFTCPATCQSGGVSTCPGANGACTTQGTCTDRMLCQ